MPEPQLASSAPYDPERTRPKPLDKLCLHMSVALLLILLAGFAPTLFLRRTFNADPIPLYLHFHGATITFWFFWLVLQTSFVTCGRTDLHRRLAFVGITLGFLVIGSNLMVILTGILHPVSARVGLEPLAGLTPWVIWISSSMLLGFVVFLYAALLYRHQPEVHKRLMLLASMCLIPAALARISAWPVFDWVGEVPFTTATWFALIVPLILHDLLVEKRVHKATIFGGVYYILSVFAPPTLYNIGFATVFAG